MANDSNDKLAKPSDAPTLVGGKLRSKKTEFQQRVASTTQSSVDPSTMPNRICLMLDCSSSMTTREAHDKTRIDLVKDAVRNFAQRCDFSNTAVAIDSFPQQLSQPLSSNASFIEHSAYSLTASGNTPMRACVQRVVSDVPLTRGVIVSDGEATDWFRSYDLEGCTGKTSDDAVLDVYKEQKIPIDCVHIGDSTSGEGLLRMIARETGGIYIKFTDVSAFSNAFGYLTPGFRGMLTDGSIDAAKLGAKEIR